MHTRANTRTHAYARSHTHTHARSNTHAHAYVHTYTSAARVFDPTDWLVLVRRYRYTLDELPAMLEKLKRKSEQFREWAEAVQNALDPDTPKTCDLDGLRAHLKRAHDLKVLKSYYMIFNFFYGKDEINERSGNLMVSDHRPPRPYATPEILQVRWPAFEVEVEQYSI